MAADDPLREDLETQLEQLRAALKDPRNPGARLDSAMAKMRKAEAKVLKCEEQLRQAEASLKSVHAEKDEASSELKAAQENAVPKQPEIPPKNAAMQLSSEDITDLTDMLKQCGLLAVRPSKMPPRHRPKGQNGTLRQRQENSPGDCKARQPSVSGPFGNSVYILEEAVKSGGDGSLDDTIAGDPRALPTPPLPCLPSPRASERGP